MGEELQRVWSHEQTPTQLRKRLLRAVLVEITATLKGRKTGKGSSWTKRRLCTFRSDRGIAAFLEGERQERGELIPAESAEHIGVDRIVTRRLIRSGILPARQTCKHAPWIIRQEALAAPEVRAELSRRRPLTPAQNQTTLVFQ